MTILLDVSCRILLTDLTSKESREEGGGEEPEKRIRQKKKAKGEKRKRKKREEQDTYEVYEFSIFKHSEIRGRYVFPVLVDRIHYKLILRDLEGWEAGNCVHERGI